MKRKPNQFDEAGQVLLQEINEPEVEPTTQKRSLWNIIAIPVLAILTGLIIGAILIAATSPSVYEAFDRSFGEGLSTIWNEVFTAYKALFAGSIGDFKIKKLCLVKIQIRRLTHPRKPGASHTYIFAGLLWRWFSIRLI